MIASLVGLCLMAASTLLFHRFSWKSLAAFVPGAVAGFPLYRVEPESYAMFLGAITVGCVAGATFRENRPLQFFLVTASLAVTLIFSVNFFVLKHGAGIDLFERSRSQFIEYVGSSELPQEKKKEITERLELSKGAMRDIVPFSYFLNGLIFSAVAFFILRFLTSRLSGKKLITNAGLEYFRLNDYFIYTIILGWLGFFLADGESLHIVKMVSLNVALIFSTLYMVQAIGIAKFILVKRGIPFFVLPLVLLVLISQFVELLLFFLIVFASIGAIDFWADFRKLKTARSGGD